VTDATERDKDTTWTRLRRRKVVQWGIAYVAGAWGLLQGLAYVSATFAWPHQLQQAATLLLLIGLPIVLVLAWYHGDRGERQITRAEFTILTVLFLLGGGAFWYYQRTSETATVSPSPVSAVAPATHHSIAVLPFVNMSADKEQEYFADGISEELLNLLAQVPELRVIARTSSFSFRARRWTSPRSRTSSMSPTFSKVACGRLAARCELLPSSFEPLITRTCGPRRTTGR
jgi:hypothetical protein